MELIVTFVLSFAFGWVLRELYAQHRINKLMTVVETAVKEDLKDKFIRIIIEQQNDMYYVYDAGDKSFMAQGSTRDELEKNLASRFPGKMFAAEPENLKNLGFTK
jgi:hypothetical protein